MLSDENVAAFGLLYPLPLPWILKRVSMLAVLCLSDELA